MRAGKRGGRLFARRLHVTSVIAAAFHGLAAVLLATRPAPRHPPPAAPDEPIAAFDVELDTAAAATARAPEPPEPGEAPAIGAAARPFPEPRAPLHPPAARARETSAEPIVEGGDGHPGAGTVDAPGSGERQGSSPAAAATASVTPDSLPPPLLPRALHAPAAALGGPLAALESQTGTSASAQVRATVQRLAETSGPTQGHGTIRITVEEDGSVSSVVASGTGWEAAAQAIRAALAGRRLRVPKGARGVTISFAADALKTRVPPVLTGEARADPVGFGGGGKTSAPTDDEHRGFHPAPPNMAVINPLALLPIPRRVVKVELLGEEPR